MEQRVYMKMKSNRIGLPVHLLLVILICAVVMATVLPLLTDTAAAASSPKKPTLISASKSGTKVTVKWKTVTGATGYEIQYADNRLFFNKKAVDVPDAAATSKKISGLSKSGDCYVRIRSYLQEGNAKYCSAWSLSSNALQDKSASQIKRDALMVKKPIIGTKTKFELRKAVKEKVGGYDTVQGSCYSKGYAYFVMENRNMTTKRCKIAKVRLSDKEVIKVSKAMNLGHGNDMTFDTKRNELVVVHSTPTPKKVTVVNPSTLKKKYSATVQLPDTIEGISDKTLKKYKNGTYTGFGAIAYNAAHDKFVVVLRGKKFHHLMILDKDFNPVRFIWLDRSSGEMMKQMLQSVDSYGDYIMVAQSYGYGYSGNNIMVYNWAGDYLSRLNLGTTYELESIFHTGETLYASYYTSGYTYSKILKTKKLYRRSYVYKLSGF